MAARVGRRSTAFAALLGALALTAATGTAPSPASVLARYDLRAPMPPVLLPDELVEVSGLAVDARGRLFAHHDEAAVVFELDPRTGAVLRRFLVGGGIPGDWEGLAIVEGRFFLSDSRGRVLEFSAGERDARVPFREIETGLGRRCELEGLGFDPAENLLLLPCKEAGGPLRGDLVVFAWSLERGELLEEPRIRVPERVLREQDLRGFRPSAVEVHPQSGTLLLASAGEAELVELSGEGDVLARGRLDRRAFPQIEGLAVGPDRTLHLASEGASGPGRMIRLPFRPPPRGGP